jgi:hypothetical protein
MDVQKDVESILTELKRTIIKASKQARSSEKVMTNDRLKNIARISNAYSKILSVSCGAKELNPPRDPYEHGDAQFYESLQE